MFDTNKETFFSFPLTDKTRKNEDKIQKQLYKSNIRRCTLSNRVVDFWNKLTTNEKRAPTVNTFKNRIDKNNIYLKLKYAFDGKQKTWMS